MAYMLSAQTAALSLNAMAFGIGQNMVYAENLRQFGVTNITSQGFMTVNNLVAEANAQLGANGLTLSGSMSRSFQEALKNIIDDANNGRNFAT